MASKYFLAFGMLSAAVFIAQARAQDKVPLGEPSTQPAAAQDLASELKGLPDGVLLVKSNPDGSFKSRVVKATVEIEDVLGGTKGKRLAERDANTQCKKALSQWLDENCVFTEASNATRSIITKGDKSTDAAGNVVKLVTQQGTEVKTLVDTDGSFSKAVLRGLIVLQSQVSDDQKTFSLVMGLSQKTLTQAQGVRDAIERSGNPTAGATASGPNQNGPADDSKPAPETKTNPAADDFK